MQVSPCAPRAGSWVDRKIPFSEGPAATNAPARGTYLRVLESPYRRRGSGRRPFSRLFRTVEGRRMPQAMMDAERQPGPG
jgi:hypothetical protein